MADDTFYYLQPARLFRLTGMFTFDGMHVTYGFQPLWMLILTCLARLTSDKVVFVRLAMLAGSLLYCSTAFLLHNLSRRWFSGLKALVAPAIWLFNRDLLSIYITGKENALYAFLLMLVLLLMYRISERNRSPKLFFSVGLVCGLLILSRVNSIIFVTLLLFWILFSTQGGWRVKVTGLGMIMAGILVVLLPWTIYAEKEFGGLIPSSGERKLIGAWAALLHYASGTFSSGFDWLSRFLPSGEQQFLAAADKLPQPSLASIAFFLVFYLPAFTVGFGIPDIAKPAYLAHPYLVLFSVSLLALALALFVGRRLNSSKEFRVGGAFGSLLREEAPVCILLIFGVMNTAVNGFLLPTFLYWGKWYAVPETLSCVVVLSLTLVALYGAAFRNFSTHARRITGSGLLVLGAFVLFFTLQPRDFSPENEYQHDAWEARGWMDKNLPKGTKVGSWSAGALGYFSDSAVVINLDGLANSPGFVDTVVRKSLLFELGLSKENVMWNYIKQNRIEYLADADFDSSLGTAPFLNIVPPENTTIVYKSSNLLDWHEARGPRRFVILRLSYDIE
jgi:4-amino-4-deoxy-L-arabinose transferase-like glycosyltransferase